MFRSGTVLIIEGGKTPPEDFAVDNAASLIIISDDVGHSLNRSGN